MEENSSRWDNVTMHIIYLVAALVVGWFLNSQFGAFVAVIGLGAAGGLIIHRLGVRDGVGAAVQGARAVADAMAETDRSRAKAAESTVGAVRVIQEIAKGGVAQIKADANARKLEDKMYYDGAQRQQRWEMEDQRSADRAAPTWYDDEEDNDSAWYRRVE